MSRANFEVGQILALVNLDCLACPGDVKSADTAVLGLCRVVTAKNTIFQNSVKNCTNRQVKTCPFVQPCFLISETNHQKSNQHFRQFAT